MGQKYAAYNSSGTIIAFYDSIDSPVPAGVTTIEITDLEWTTCLANPGYTVVSGALVAPPVPTANQLLSAAQTAQINVLSAACAAEITGGFTSSSNGATHTYPSAQTDQLNLTASVTTSLVAMAQPAWAANTAYAVGQTITSAGQAYVCTTAGTSGEDIPTWPTAIGTSVTDGTTLTWEIWTTLFWAIDANAYLPFSASEIQQLGLDVKNFIASCLYQNNALGNQVLAATTVAAVQAITWTAP